MNGPDMTYRRMLVKVSDEILKREDGVDMLKFTYSDFTSIKAYIDKADTPFKVFQILENAGILQKTDATILFETSQLLGLSFLEDILKTNGLSNGLNQHSKISLFIPYRQRIIRFAKVLLQVDVENIGNVCGVPMSRRNNQWTLLQYLQDECNLSEQTVAQFIEAIKGIGVNIEDALQSKQDVINPRIDETEEALEVNCQHIQLKPLKFQDEPHHFKDLMSLLTRWFQRSENLNKLKVLLQDILKNHCNINAITNVPDLFDRLYLAGILRPQNLTIVYEMIVCTGQWGLEWEIRKLVPSCPHLSQLRIGIISEYRFRLIQFGNALTVTDWEKIDGACNFPRKRYRDAWSMIIDLEKKGDICEGRLEDFVTMLIHHDLANAVEAFTFGPSLGDLP